MKNWRDKKKSEKLSTLEKIQNKQASHVLLDTIVEDIRRHIEENPAGTLENYNGGYGRALISSIDENYPGTIPQELREATVRKSLRLKNKIFELARQNKKIFTHPSLLKMLLDDLEGRREDSSQNKITVINTGFQLSDTGNFIEPEGKI